MTFLAALGGSAVGTLVGLVLAAFLGALWDKFNW